MKNGDSVKFTDVSGEVLYGKVVNTIVNNKPNLIQVLAYKESWAMSVKVILVKNSVTLINA